MIILMRSRVIFLSRYNLTADKIHMKQSTKESNLFNEQIALLLYRKICSVKEKERKKNMKTKSRLCEVIGETLVVRLPEELDHHTAGLIKEDTEELFLQKRIRNVIFDYQQTVFMDSSGIGLVMGRYREVRYLNGNVYIVGVQNKIARILEISGLYRVAIQAGNIEAALQDIQNRQEKNKVKENEN